MANVFTFPMIGKPSIISGGPMALTSRFDSKIWNARVGWRISGDKAAARRDPGSQCSCLYAPRGDRTTIVAHQLHVGRTARQHPSGIGRTAWLWIGHVDTRSFNSRPCDYDGERLRTIAKAIRAGFDQDSALIEGSE